MPPLNAPVDDVVVQQTGRVQELNGSAQLIQHGGSDTHAAADLKNQSGPQHFAALNRGTEPVDLMLEGRLSQGLHDDTSNAL